MNSIEEDIKIVEDFILKTDVDYSEYNEQIVGDISYQAIQHLLSDYKKLQEEFKQIDDECDRLEKIDFEKDMRIKELQKENEELKEKENKIYKEVQESLAFEKFLVKERKPDLFNQGRFYISQIIYDILNDVQNPEGIHKENKCIQYIDYIPIQKIKDIIDRIDYDIKKTKEIISKNTNIYASYRKNDYQIVRLRAMNTKSLDIKKRLQELLESEE